ncbi:MAG: hypothetical protein V7731_01640 [Amphritea sp.]
MSESSHNKVLHHLGTAFGLLGLAAYYLLIDQSEFLDWITSLMPDKYAGSGLMIGIMIAMTPAFFAWKHYNRYMERKLGVKGRYIEDEYYKHQEKHNKKD